MKSSIIVDLIKGLIAKNPERFKALQWLLFIIIIAMCGIAGVNGLGLVTVPDWVLNVASPTGEVGKFIASFLGGGIIWLQFPKKDINEGK